MAELSTVLTAAGGMKVFFQEYDSNESYPLATPPGDMPCLVITRDTSFAGFSYFQNAYFYYQDPGGITTILNTYWGAEGS